MFDTNVSAFSPLYLCFLYDSYHKQSLFAFTNYTWLLFLIEACCIICEMYINFTYFLRRRPPILQEMRHFSIPPWCSLCLRSCGILAGFGWQLVTDVSGQSIGPIFKGQSSNKNFFAWHWTNSLCQKVVNQMPTYTHISQWWRSQNKFYLQACWYLIG